MVMFDYVNIKLDCPSCGEVITKWQTKDAECNLDLVEVSDISYFYSDCPNCGEWFNYTVEKAEHIETTSLKEEGVYKVEKVEEVRIKLVEKDGQ